MIVLRESAARFCQQIVAKCQVIETAVEEYLKRLAWGVDKRITVQVE